MGKARLTVSPVGAALAWVSLFGAGCYLTSGSEPALRECNDRGLTLTLLITGAALLPLLTLPEVTRSRPFAFVNKLLLAAPKLGVFPLLFFAGKKLMDLESSRFFWRCSYMATQLVLLSTLLSLRGAARARAAKAESESAHDLVKIKAALRKQGILFLVIMCIHFGLDTCQPFWMQTFMAPLDLWQSPLFQVSVIGRAAEGALARPWDSFGPKAEYTPPEKAGRPDVFVRPPANDGPVLRSAALAAGGVSSSGSASAAGSGSPELKSE